MLSKIRCIPARKPETKRILCLPPVLRQLIQDYLQYEEALVVYTYLETKPATRPIFHLDQADFLSKLEKEQGSPTGHSTYYIEHKEGVRMTEKYLKALFALDQNYKFYWQCPICLNYVLLEFNKNIVIDMGLNVKGWSLYSSSGYRNHQLCNCRIAIEEKARRNREKVEIRRETITMTNRKWNEIYTCAMQE
jgi:hypothetical protein